MSRYYKRRMLSLTTYLKCPLAFDEFDALSSYQTTTQLAIDRGSIGTTNSRIRTGISASTAGLNLACIVDSICGQCCCFFSSFIHSRRSIIPSTGIRFFATSTTTTTSPVCPECGIKKDSGQLSCCARGGAWFGNCGGAGDAKFDHTWFEGIQACTSKLQVEQQTTLLRMHLLVMFTNIHIDTNRPVARHHNAQRCRI